MIKIIGCNRCSLIGDCVVSLPFCHYLERYYPNSTKIAFLDLKCQQLAPLLLNAPNLDGIRISNEKDKINQIDEEYFKKFDMVFEPFVPIIEENWYNKMGIVEATFKMNWLRGAGRIKPEEWNKLTDEEKKPRLNCWFNIPKNNDYIALWSASGYNNDTVNQKRNPSKQYLIGLVDRLIKEGYKVAQFGTTDHDLVSERILDLRHYSLFDAIRFSLGCNASIQTDSGSAHILGGCGSNQILLTTYWRNGHYRNPDALIPVNYKNRAINLFCESGVDNIQYDKIIEGIKLLNE